MKQRKQWKPWHCIRDPLYFLGRQVRRAVVITYAICVFCFLWVWTVGGMAVIPRAMLTHYDARVPLDYLTVMTVFMVPCCAYNHVRMSIRIWKWWYAGYDLHIVSLLRRLWAWARPRSSKSAP